MVKTLIRIILIVIVFGAIMYLNVYQHERVHYEINRHEGIDSIVVIPFPPTSNVIGQTIPLNDVPCDTNCRLAHNINEIVGYHVTALIFSLIGMIILWKLMGDN